MTSSLLQNSNGSVLANSTNTHDAASFTSKQGPVTGSYVVGNTNIQRGGRRKKTCRKRKRRRRKRARRRRSRRGGGYGINPNGTPGYGVMPIKAYAGCGVPKDPNLNVAIQHIGSPPPQRGGGCKGGGCSGSPYYGYTEAVPGITNYAPITPLCQPQCGGGRRKGRKRSRRRRKSRSRRRSRSRSRRRQRGGYSQYGSDIPSTPGYATPNGGNWQVANPPTHARNDACGTGNCVDNYNHYTGKGSPSVAYDKDVSPLPPPTVIKTPNITTQCGGRRRRTKRRHRRRTKRRHRRRTKRRHRRKRRGGHGTTWTQSAKKRYSQALAAHKYVCDRARNAGCCSTSAGST